MESNRVNSNKSYFWALKIFSSTIDIRKSYKILSKYIFFLNLIGAHIIILKIKRIHNLYDYVCILDKVDIGRMYSHKNEM